MRAGPRTARLPLPAGVALSRPALDGMLADAAVAAGATFRDGVAARIDHACADAGDEAPCIASP